jgi:small subunit ribosomal protein S20
MSRITPVTRESSVSRPTIVVCAGIRATCGRHYTALTFRAHCPDNARPYGERKSAEKRARQAVASRARNVAQRSSPQRRAQVVEAINAGKKAEAAAALKAAAPVIDSMARKGIIHRNKAARHKSRLAAQIKAMPAK